MARKKYVRTAGLTLGLAVVLGGCAGTAPVIKPAENTAPVKKEAVKAIDKNAIPVEDQIISGKVVETMDAGGYTYISIEKDGTKTWVAVPGANVAVGQEIQVRPGTQMGQFTSKTLKRTFDNIIFSNGMVTDSKVTPSSEPVKPDATTNSLPPGHPPMDSQAPPEGHAGMMTPPGKATATVTGKVVETMDSGGYTYVNLENAGKNVWVAVPAMKVSVGQELKLQSGATMTNFNSKSLNKTFDSVIFSAGPLPE